MNLENYRKLKLKYRLIQEFVVYISIILGFSIGFAFMYLYANYLGLDIHSPDTGNDNVFEYTVAVSGVSIIFSYLVAAYIICKFKNWTATNFINCFFRCKNYPKHWFKD